VRRGKGKRQSQRQIAGRIQVAAGPVDPLAVQVQLDAEAPAGDLIGALAALLVARARQEVQKNDQRRPPPKG